MSSGVLGRAGLPNRSGESASGPRTLRTETKGQGRGGFEWTKELTWGLSDDPFRQSASVSRQQRARPKLQDP